MRNAQRGASPYVAIAAAVGPGRGEFVDALATLTEAEIGELNHDDSLRRLLRASISENVDLLVDTVLAQGINPRSTTPPEAALEYAVRLARSRASLASLLRAYRIGQAQFTAYCLGLAARLDPPMPTDDQIAMVNAIAGYLDHVCEQVSSDYQREYERWLGGQQGLRQLWVTRLLAGGTVDVSEAVRALGYPVGGTHLAAELWIEPGADGLEDSEAVMGALTAAAGAVSHELGGAAWLSVPRSDRDLWIWTQPSGAVPMTGLAKRLASRLPAAEAVRVALGSVGAGLEGFRTSHRRALRVRRLMVSAAGQERRVLDWAQVAPVAALTVDAGVDAPDLVAGVLGRLGADEPRLAELRETLRVFLEHNRSYAVTADLLHLHRNTVRYRVQQALTLADVEPDGNTFALLAALNAARWS